MSNDTPLTDTRKDHVLIGRQPDGLIFAAMPAGPFAITFMLLVQDHLSINCAMVDSMAYHMTTEEVRMAKVVDPTILKIVLENLKTRHKAEFTDSVWKQGNSEILDGMFYTEMHPLDLAGIAESLKELAEKVGDNALYPSISNVVELWIDAAERFVNAQEFLAASGYEGKA